MSDNSSDLFCCPNCDFTTSSQNGVGIHRIKTHTFDDSSIKSVSVIRSYPEGKRFLCWICGNSIGSFPNFNRHFKNNHPNTSLLVTGFCSICKKTFPNAMAASVHCKRSHGVSKMKNSKIPPPDPNSSLILSSISEKRMFPDQPIFDESSPGGPGVLPLTPQPATQSVESTSPISDLCDFGISASVDEPHPSSHHDNSLSD